MKSLDIIRVWDSIAPSRSVTVVAGAGVGVASVGDTRVSNSGAPVSGVTVGFPLRYTTIYRAVGRAIIFSLVCGGGASVGAWSEGGTQARWEARDRGPQVGASPIAWLFRVNSASSGGVTRHD